MFEIIALVGGGLLLWLAVSRFGADSRDGNDWREQPPGGSCTNC